MVKELSFKITYETLFDVLRKESSREDLQEIPQTFYEEVRSFLDEKKAESNGNQRAAIEYENTKKILRELYDRRERKLLLLALNKARTQSAIIDPSILLPEERTLFDDLVGRLRENKKMVLGVSATAPPAPVTTPKPHKPESLPRQSAEVTLKEPQPESGVRVLFLKPVPKFIGRDMTIFGPFNKGDSTELPPEVANVLAKKGHVELSTSP